MTIEENVPLSRFTTLGTGGPAAWLAEPDTQEKLGEVLSFARERGFGVAVIGLGSNLLVADEGVSMLVLRLRGDLAGARVSHNRVFAGGGSPNAVVLHRARAAGLSGFEFACAIPGTVGGGVWMNAGAYGSDFAAVLVNARVFSADGDQTLTPPQLEMTYRTSNLRQGQVVAEACLELTTRPEEEIKATIRELQLQRKASQPTNKRTFGSVFKNPEHELTAGRMLEACGLKGFRIGGAQISPMHANFIENAGGASTEDAVALMVEARRRAHEEYGVVLTHEVEFLGLPELPPVGAE